MIRGDSSKDKLDSQFAILGHISEVIVSFGTKEIKMCLNAREETPGVEMRSYIFEQADYLQCLRSYSGNFGFFGFTPQNPNSM